MFAVGLVIFLLVAAVLSAALVFFLYRGVAADATVTRLEERITAAQSATEENWTALTTGDVEGVAFHQMLRGYDQQAVRQLIDELAACPHWGEKTAVQQTAAGRAAGASVSPRGGATAADVSVAIDSDALDEFAAPAAGEATVHPVVADAEEERILTADERAALTGAAGVAVDSRHRGESNTLGVKDSYSRALACDCVAVLDKQQLKKDWDGFDTVEVDALCELVRAHHSGR